MTDLTPAQLDELKTRLTAALKHGRIEICPPLPRKVRVRLWFEHQVNGAATWLIEHQHFTAAEMLWRTFGMWT